jgi:acetyltransferase-like isoleucine patch superfamily enzyme
MNKSVIRYFYYPFKYIAIFVKPFWGRNAYMALHVIALKFRGVAFLGKPRYIDTNIFVDAEGLLTIGTNVVVSTGVKILTHDYSFTTGLDALGNRPNTDIEIRLPVTIGNNVFIGAGTIILPGTCIMNNVIIGAGSVVHGNINENSVYAGNPAKYLCDIRQWANNKLSQTDPKSFYKDLI